MPACSSTDGSISSMWAGLYESLNWFRIHLLAFTFLPLIFSGFFAAANPGAGPIASYGAFVTQYIDNLFMCFSAMTGSGVSTISPSQLQTAQQAFLLVLIILGDITVVSLITLGCRLVWWHRQCGRIVRSTLVDDLYKRHGASLDTQLENGRADEPGTDSRDDDGDQGDSQDGGRHRNKDSGNQREVRARRNQPKSDDSKRGRAAVPHASSGQKRHSGRGGFPGVYEVAPSVLRLISPSSHSYLSDLLRQNDNPSRTPREAIGDAIKKPFKDREEKSERRHALAAAWLPKGVRRVVTNDRSEFFEEELNEEDLEVLGVLEYRATKLMMVILFAHLVFWIMMPSSVIAIYFARVHYWDASFVANGTTQIGNVHTTWFAFFQGVSAYASCGLSLVDELMLPFQNCYLLIWVLFFPMLAGNQVLPIFLRFEVWILSKIFRDGSETSVLLHFILTHGRRVFLYLFPAYQSWWLLFIEFFLWALGTVLFIAFNQGLGYYDTLGAPFERFSVALFQSLCARATGFDIVQLAYLAPATPKSGRSTCSEKLTWRMIIFTSNYPVVMGIRSTNVYEERALGLNGDHAPGQHNEKSERDQGKGHIYSKYLKQHLLPQIYFDLWPVFVGTLLILIIERTNLVDPNNSGWIGVFQILFEVTSAYANVGLSYSNPFNTSSLTATFRNLSKFIVILLMLRGRHRGLPLAIDRATMYAVEYERLSPGQREHVEEDRTQEAGEEAEDE